MPRVMVTGTNANPRVFFRRVHLGLSLRRPLALPHLRGLLLRAHGVGPTDAGLRGVTAACGHAGDAAAAAAHRERVHVAVAVHAHLKHGAAGASHLFAINHSYFFLY